MDLELTNEPLLKCSECGETKEVTANYINLFITVQNFSLNL